MKTLAESISRIQHLRQLLDADKIDQFILELQENDFMQSPISPEESNKIQVLQLLNEIKCLMDKLQEKNISLSSEILNVKKQITASKAYQNNTP